MGKMLIDGELRDKPSADDGRFVRLDSGFRDWISCDGSTEFPAEAGRYLTGRRITEADWRLFTTLIRFDPVYATHFKTDRRRIAEYPNLGAYLRELYQIPGIAQTVDMDHIRQHYFQSHKHLNPAGIIPIGPDINLDRPALREDVGLLAMEAVQ